MAGPNPEGAYRTAQGTYPSLDAAYRPAGGAYPGAYPNPPAGLSSPAVAPPRDLGDGRLDRGRAARSANRRTNVLIAAALAGVVVVVGGTIGLVTGGGGAGAEEAQGGRQELQGFVNGAPDQERDAATADKAAPPPGETAQVRLVGPSRATAGKPIRVVAAFRGLSEGQGLRAFVQAMTPDGRVGAAKAASTCRLDKAGDGGTLTGSCPGVPAGSYRIAVAVEKAAYRPGDFPPVDVGRLVVAPAGAAGSTQGTKGAEASGGGQVPASHEIRAVERRMVELTNEAREDAGLEPLAVDSALTSTSRDWACDMAAERTLQHDPNFADSGAQGENVAFRTDPGDDVALLLHEQFMNSPGHRDNILNDRWGAIGIGFCARNGFWVTERFAP